MNRRHVLGCGGGETLAAAMTHTAVRAVLVTLLNTPVTAWVALNRDEQRRREAIGLGAVTDPALLDLLLNLPLGVPVADPAAWAETAARPDGIVSRSEDGCTITRHLDSPLYLQSVVVTASPGYDLRASARRQPVRQLLPPVGRHGPRRITHCRLFASDAIGGRRNNGTVSGATWSSCRSQV